MTAATQLVAKWYLYPFRAIRTDASQRTSRTATITIGKRGTTQGTRAMAIAANAPQIRPCSFFCAARRALALFAMRYATIHAGNDSEGLYWTLTALSS